MPALCFRESPTTGLNAVTRQARISFCDEDNQRYRDLLDELAPATGVEIWAWVQKPNHVHLIVLPDADTLRRELAPVGAKRATCIPCLTEVAQKSQTCVFFPFPLISDRMMSVMRVGGHVARDIAKARFAVFGSVHVDIIGHSQDNPDHVDKVGRIEVRLGGSALNISINLSRLGHAVNLWTAVRSESVVEKWILGRLRREKISTQSITHDRRSIAGAFVANKHDGKYISAVTSTGVDRSELPIRRIKGLVSRSTAVVVDCNLSVDQLTNVLRVANARKRPITISSVSETKVVRFAEAQSGNHVPVFGVGLDALTFQSLLNHFETKGITGVQGVIKELNLFALSVFDKFEPILANAKHRIGCTTYFADGHTYQWEDVVDGHATSTGARDALISGLAIMSAHNEALDHIKFPELFRTYVGPTICRVILGERVNIGDIATESSLDNFGIEETPTSLSSVILRRIGSFLNRVAQIIAGGLSLIAALDQLFPGPVRPILEWIFETLMH